MDFKEFPDFIKLLTYYEVLRKNVPANSVPQKQDLNPKDIISLLPMLSLTERVASGKVIVRLTGTALDTHFLANITGDNIVDYYRNHDKRLITAFHDKISAGPYGGFSHVRVRFDDNSLIDCRSIYLPLCATDGDPRFHLNVNHIESIQYGTEEIADEDLQKANVKIKHVCLFNLFDGPEYSVVKKLL